MSLYLHGIGHFYPPNVITNEFITALEIGTDEEWIMERVGIETRHTVLDLDYIRTTKNSDPRAACEASLFSNARTGAEAARMALQRAGLEPQDIGLVVSGSCAPDTVTPAEAATIAAELGLNAPCFDLKSACSSFGMQVSFLSGMKPEALPPFVLIVNPENWTRCLDYSDRRVAPLLGDGSTAAVVSRSVPSKLAFTSCHYESEPAKWQKVTVTRMGFFEQDGKAVQGFAIRKATECVRRIQSLYGENLNRFKFIGHQANMRMLSTVCERCNIPEDKHWFNVNRYGNTGAAAAPGVISQYWDDFFPGIHIAIAQVGAGLTWVSMMLRMEEQDS